MFASHLPQSTNLQNITEELEDLPIPEDDGACNHLKGSRVPSVTLLSTSEGNVDLSKEEGLIIVFFYPRTAAPNEIVPDEWNSIPGARGCTPQTCSFRDHVKDLTGLGVRRIYGISTQDTPYQQEARERLRLPYNLLSDEKLKLAQALTLPTFEWKGRTLIKRLALAIKEGQIVNVWYPIFPPGESAEQVRQWLETQRRG